jgi:hypothetical protein
METTAGWLLDAVWDAVAFLQPLQGWWKVAALPLCLIGGLEFRRRGGLLGPWIREHLLSSYETGKSRWLDGLTVTMWMVLVTQDGRLFVLLPLNYAGLVMGWFHCADLGRDGDRPWWVEFPVMSLRGLLLTGLAGLGAWSLGYGPWFALSGLALGLCYELGHRTPSDTPDFHRGMELGEFYFGTWRWAAALFLL